MSAGEMGVAEAIERGRATREGIRTEAELRNVLARITFAPSCVDMGWEWKVEWVDFIVGEFKRTNEGWLVSTTFQRPDRDTGVIARGEGRKWFIRVGESESGVVKTAFAAAKMILEHELMEAFRIGARVFDPHRTVEDLCSLPTRR